LFTFLRIIGISSDERPGADALRGREEERAGEDEGGGGGDEGGFVEGEFGPCDDELDVALVVRVVGCRCGNVMYCVRVVKDGDESAAAREEEREAELD